MGEVLKIVTLDGGLRKKNAWFVINFLLKLAGLVLPYRFVPVLFAPPATANAELSPV